MFRLAPLVAARAIADSSDGISLLQTAVHGRAAVSDEADDLPDPKKQSQAGTDKVTEVDMWDPVDFNCKGGKGKWVWFTNQPIQGQHQDLSTKTLDIAQMDHHEDARYEGGQVRSSSYPWTPGPHGSKIWGQQSFTEHGPVKNEKDCFNRAQIDQKCNHWMEDLKYASLNPTYKGQDPWSWTSQERGMRWGSAKFVFYKPNGYMKTGFNGGGGTCFCGNFGQSAGQKYHVAPPTDPHHQSGWWACKLEPSDFAGVDENTEIGQASGPSSDEPKEKKTKEERKVCKAKRKAAKESRDALNDIKRQVKAARDALKPLIAQLKAARADFKLKKGDKKDAC